MAKQKCPEFENHERWLVSYADMVTLLFAVFVVLYSLNLTNSDKNEQVAGSMQESFNTPLEDIPVDRRIGPTESGSGIFDHLRGNSARPPLVQRYPGARMPVPVIEEEMKQVNASIEERLYGPNRFREAKSGEDRIVDVVRDAKGFKLRLMARHFYDEGSVRVKQAALKDLDVLAKILKELGRPIVVEGHTDSIPPTGEMSNWEVSALRATHVLRYLVREHNFPPARLSAAGYADTKPIAHNGTEAGRALNRRVELHIEYDTEATPEPY